MLGEKLLCGLVIAYAIIGCIAIVPVIAAVVRIVRTVEVDLIQNHSIDLCTRIRQARAGSTHYMSGSIGANNHNHTVGDCRKRHGVAHRHQWCRIEKYIVEFIFEII
jgi:hypothetical protein